MDMNYYNAVLAKYNLEGFYRVKTGLGGLRYDTFFNPETRETKQVCIADYDDFRNDKYDLGDLPLAERAFPEVHAAFIAEIRRRGHLNGGIYEGDLIEVFKGRKVPIGTVARVVKFSEWKDRYGRTQTTYAHLDNGMKTNIANCRWIEEK